MRKKRLSVEQKSKYAGLEVDQVRQMAQLQEGAASIHELSCGCVSAEISQARVRYGYRKIRVLLNREGWDVGKFLVQRLCKKEGLMLKRMKPAGSRKAVRFRVDKFKPTAPDQAWSMDFVLDQLQDGTRFRSLTIVGVYT